MKLEMGPRRIQVIHNTAFVSLPKTWVKNCQLDKGDRVNLTIREDGVLEISSSDGGKTGCVPSGECGVEAGDVYAEDEAQDRFGQGETDL